ncbi:Homeodomain-like protein [Colletotrichum lupini]|nr:Homeodomain-like protein [Colletotrichum lupini]
MSVEDSSPCSPRANSTTRPRKIWTPEEDVTLKTLVARYGDARGPQGHWKDIAAALQDRTAKDCRKRWFHSLDPSIKKGRWTAEEDQTLLSAYARMGPAWHDIALLIPGRKDDQCSKRYMDILSPKVKDRLSGWSPQEDEVLREGVRTLGHRWSALSAKLPGRPPLTCRNRWRALSKTSKKPLTTGTPSPRSPATRKRGDATASDAPEPSLNSLLVATGSDADIGNVIDINGIVTSMVELSTGLDTDDFRFVGDAVSYNSILHQSQLSSNLPPSLDLGHVSEPLHQSLREPTSNSHNSTPKEWRSNKFDTEIPQTNQSSTVRNLETSFSVPDITLETPALSPDPICSRISPSQYLYAFSDGNLPSQPTGPSIDVEPPQQVVHHHHHYHHHYHHHHHHYHETEENLNGSLRQLEIEAETKSLQS